MILGADPIDVLEINAHSERLVLLRDHDDVGEPLGVVHLTDELGCQEPSNFFANGLPLLCSRATKMLLHRFAFGSTRKRCSASSLGTPGMSDGFHAKMSQF